MNWPVYTHAQLFECRLGHRWSSHRASECDQCHTHEVYRIVDEEKILVDKTDSGAISDDNTSESSSTLADK